MGAFNELQDSNLKGEFFGSMCRWHLRKDGQITIYEIVVEQSQQNQGLGCLFLERLKKVDKATSIFAKCPSDLPSNLWYKKQGFTLENTELLKTGKIVNHWRLRL